MDLDETAPAGADLGILYMQNTPQSVTRTEIGFLSTESKTFSAGLMGLNIKPNEIYGCTVIKLLSNIITVIHFYFSKLSGPR